MKLRFLRFIESLFSYPAAYFGDLADEIDTELHKQLRESMKDISEIIIKRAEGGRMKKIFKPKNRPRTLADILFENEEMDAAGKGIPEELIKPSDHVDYYDGMDGPVPPAYIIDRDR